MRDLAVAPTADCESCVGCGWNPAVEQARKEQIRALAAAGMLHTWGVDPAWTPLEVMEQRRRRLIACGKRWPDYED